MNRLLISLGIGFSLFIVCGLLVVIFQGNLGFLIFPLAPVIFLIWLSNKLPTFQVPIIIIGGILYFSALGYAILLLVEFIKKRRHK